jgi:hypothetical protein
MLQIRFGFEFWDFIFGIIAVLIRDSITKSI